MNFAPILSPIEPDKKWGKTTNDPDMAIINLVQQPNLLVHF